MTEMLEHLFGASPCPVLYCDSGLHPVWKNRAADACADAVLAQDGPLAALAKDDSLRAILRSRGQLRVPAHSLPKGLGSLTLAAAGEGVLCVASAGPGTEAAATALSAYLREPLSSIFAFLPLLSRIFAHEDGADTYLSEINRSCYKLLRITENLALHARITGNEAFPLSPCDVSASVEAICSAADTVCKGLAIPFTWTLQPGLTARIYEPLLCHTLANLLLNAFTYTRDGNAVSVTLTATGSQLRLAVSDRGTGIRGEALGHVFEPYFSRDPYGDAPRAESAPGVGLGLAIARGAVELMGGRILLQSVFGEGTTAMITLPRYAGAPAALASVPADYLLNRFSTVYLQLCSVCRLPDIF